jgi:hypothetical protein
VEPIVLGRPIVDGTRLRVPISPGSARFGMRGDEFWVEYAPLGRLADLDEALLVIPALGTVLTVGYALGVPVQVGSVDRAFAEAAEKVAGTFGEMYPAFRTSHFELRGQRVHTRSPIAADRTAALLLFSAGIDSTSSLIQHRDEVEALLTVWGADVRSADEALWSQLCAVVSDNGLVAGRQSVLARSNMRDLFDEAALSRHVGGETLGGGWWGSVQHGMALACLAVPAAAMCGLGRVLLASSDLHEDGIRWGSAPTVDGQIRWTGGRVEHDQADMYRLQKVTDVIAPYLRAGGRLTLSVCYQAGRGGTGVNCGRCEKCLRTVTELLVAGISPRDVGLPLTPQLLSRARVRLAKGAWHGDEYNAAYWHAIKAAVPTTFSGVTALPFVRDYLEWLRANDVVLNTSGTLPLRHRLVAAAGYLTGNALDRLPLRTRKWINRMVARVLDEG